jgi:uncharacterized protein (DUF2235 family)
MESIAQSIPNADRVANPLTTPRTQRRKFVLCFDGTGNKFLGNAGDSNSRPDFRRILSDVC